MQVIYSGETPRRIEEEKSLGRGAFRQRVGLTPVKETGRRSGRQTLAPEWPKKDGGADRDPECQGCPRGAPWGQRLARSL